MTQIVFLDAFDRPFLVRVVDGEVTVQSEQAPIELVFTPTSARETAHRLLHAADQVEKGDRRTSAAKRGLP
ncbi:MAG: hypothetical protein JO303_15580 [Caulobacteraceae bacterium]|nr:hypothetical protein [Caulobacteraceae bacterium]